MCIRDRSSASAVVAVMSVIIASIPFLISSRPPVSYTHLLNELDDADYIRQGNHPSRSKSVYITAVSYTHLDVYKRQPSRRL